MISHRCISLCSFLQSFSFLFLILNNFCCLILKCTDAFFCLLTYALNLCSEIIFILMIVLFSSRIYFWIFWIFVLINISILFTYHFLEFLHIFLQLFEHLWGLCVGDLPSGLFRNNFFVGFFFFFKWTLLSCFFVFLVLFFFIAH